MQTAFIAAVCLASTALLLWLAWEDVAAIAGL